MNKNLLIISLILISLLAIGGVSAADSYNATDSAISMANEDIGIDQGVNEIDNLEAVSQVEELEVDEEQNVLKEMNNQSTDVLSDDNSNSNKPVVTVDDVTFKSGNISVPFHVADSKGNPISGQAIVTILSEKNTISKNVKLINGSGQIDFKITEVLGTMGVDNEDIPAIYDIISSSITDMKINVSEIISGFKDVYNSFSINVFGIIDALYKISETNYVNVSEINTGVETIENSFSINRTGIEEGIKEIISGLEFNISKIMQLVLINITGNDINFTKIGNDLKVFIDNYTLKISNFLDNLSQKVSFNKTAFNDALDDFFNEFNITRQVALDKIEELMTNLNFASELKDNVIDILNGNNLTFSNIFNVFKDVIATNLTISNVTDLFSDVINGSNISNALENILHSFKIDYDKIADDFNNIFNASKIYDEFLNITGIISTKLSNVFEGIMDIYNGISFNMSNLISGFKEIFNATSWNSSSIKEILMGIKYNGTSLSEMFENFLDDLPYLALTKVSQFIEYLQLNFTSECEKLILDAIQGNYPSFKDAIHVLNGMMVFNNLTMSDVFDALDNVSGGYLFNISKIADIIKDYANVSKIIDVFNNISINYTQVFKGLYDLISLNMSKVSDGWSNILNSVNLNVSAINAGFDKITREFNFNASKIIDSLRDHIAEYVSINASAIVEGAKKVADSFYLNVSSIKDGASQIAGAFKFDLKGIWSGVKEIINSFSFNFTKFKEGINKIVQLPSINISGIITKLMAVLSKNAVLSFFLIPDSSIYSLDFKLPSRIDCSKVSTTYGKSKKMTVTLKDILGNPIGAKKVSVKLNGKTYSGNTNAKGQFSINIPKKLVPKTYNAVITFNGDNDFIKSSKTVKVVVSKLTPKLTAKKKTFKKSVKTKKYTVSLKTNKNKAMKKKKVTLKVNGKTYKAKTNSKGKATFKITKLTKKGTFKAVIKFKGDKYYKKVTKKANIKIK